MPLTAAALADTRHHLHPYTQLRQLEQEGPLVIVRGDGVHVVDEHGHSYFRETDLPQTGIPRRISSKNQKVLWWKMSLSQPGHEVDFQVAPALMFVAVFSGQMNLTVSNGETRHFVRGDMLTLFDTRGQGHILRVVGLEPCHALWVALPDRGGFS